MNKTLLIIFVKNPELGKVKTRLAATVGEEKALAIYYKLLQNVQNVVKDLPVDKAVFYSRFIDTEDNWNNDAFKKRQQTGGDLGEKMFNAFVAGFQEKYKRICLVGTDIYSLSSDIILKGFEILKNQDIVLGPAEDGGYYLIGMKKQYESLFKDMTWSTSSVFDDTVSRIKEIGLTYATLPVLNDIDEEKDLEGTDLA